MKTAHLFAGAGGGILADLILGHTPTHAYEIDPYACEILRQRFPGLSVHEGDIRSADFGELVGVDAICAGFPCQDISAAGRGAGITGERSGLFSEVLRAIDVVRPSWVFLENSPRIRTRGRREVLASLVARGYSWRDGILGAADVGAPHRRDRWWCLAKRSNTDGERKLQPQGSVGDQRNRPCDLGTPISDSAGMRSEEPRPGQEIDEEQATPGDRRCAGWWTAEPGMGRMAHGVANRPHRIHALGNGQVPLCAALAWKLLGGP